MPKEYDHVLVAIDEEMTMETLDVDNDHSFIFIGDSGASVHMSGSLAGMMNVRDCWTQVRTANGKLATATKIGDKKCYVFDKDGKRSTI